MPTPEKPTPFQIRLPKEVDQALREVSVQTHRTLNSVVIEALMEYLPVRLEAPASAQAMRARTPREHALAHLDAYQTTLHAQLQLVLSLAGDLNEELMRLRNTQADVSSGVDPVVPPPLEVRHQRKEFTRLYLLAATQRDRAAQVMEFLHPESS